MEVNSLYDVSVLLITALPVFLTVLLTLIAANINNKINNNDDRIRQVEGKLRAEKEELYGLRVVSNISLKFVSDAYASIDLHKRQISDIMSNKSGGFNQDNIDNFEKQQEELMGRLSRISLFMRLLTPMYGGVAELEERLSDLIEKYPDIETLSFLTALSKIEHDEFRAIIQGCYDRLSVQLFGYDSYAWTGRRSWSNGIASSH